MFFFGLFNSITSQICDNKLAKSTAFWVEKGQRAVFCNRFSPKILLFCRAKEKEKEK